MTPARTLALVFLLLLLLFVIGLPIASRTVQPYPTSVATYPSIGGDATTQEWGP